MLRINVAWKQIEEQLNNPVSNDFVSLIDGCFEKVTLKSGEQVRSRVKGEELLKSVANFVNRAKLFGWEPERSGSHVYDHIHLDDQPWNYIVLMKNTLDYCFRWNIHSLNQTSKNVEDPDDRRIFLESKYGSECHSKIERYESLKKRRKELLTEVHFPWFFSSPDDPMYQFLLGMTDEQNPDKAREIRDLTTEMQKIKDEISEAFIPYLKTYEPQISLEVHDKNGRFVSLSLIPEEKRRDIIEIAKTIRYVLSSDWTGKFDETFYQELQSKLYRVCGEIPKLKETVKTVLDTPMYLIPCPADNQGAKYVEQNQFNSELFMDVFEKAIKETCTRHPIGNLCPKLGITWKTDGFLAGISLMESDDTQREYRSTQQKFRGSRGKIYVLYEGDSIDFILPQGGLYDKLNEAMVAHDGTINCMFYGSPRYLSASIRDLCMRSHGFSNMVQGQISGKIIENLNRNGLLS
jgi:hypothetical protein